MSNSRSSDFSEYRQMNGDAHRMRSRNLVPPTLIWHQAFWIVSESGLASRKQEGVETKTNPPHESSAADRNESRTRRENFKNCIDKFLSIVSKNESLGDFSDGKEHRYVTPRVDGRSIFFANISKEGKKDLDEDFFNKRITNYDMKDYEGITSGQIDLLNSDHRSISVAFSWRSDGREIDVCVRFEMHTEFFTQTIFLHPNKEIFQSTIDNFSTEKIQNLGEYLYNDIWNKFYEDLFSESYAKIQCDIDIFRHQIADFRGVVVDSHDITKNTSVRVEDGGASSGVGNGARLAWASPIVDSVRPLIKPPGATAERYECIASYMLDGRVLYVSALGPQVPNVSDGKRIPVTYLMVVNQGVESRDGATGVNKWQLGRLVHALHTCGESRIAALKDLVHLRRAGAALAGMDEPLSQARSAVSGDLGAAQDEVTKAHNKFNELNNKFIDTIGKSYGILYRVERSRYYVTRFRENTKFLRMIRVDGYQLYDQFIERRLGTTFDFIDRLGKRYERSVNSLSLLDRQLLAMNSVKAAARQEEISSRIEKIQEAGEIALIGLLLPYYFAGVVDAVVLNEDISHIINWVMIPIMVGIGIFKLIKLNKPETENNSETNHNSYDGWAMYISITIIIFIAIFLLIVGGFEKKKEKEVSMNRAVVSEK